MDKHSVQTKPADDRLFQTTGEDWDPVDVIAAIWKRKSSLIRLSRLNGYKGDGLKLALRQPWPKAERIIAEFLGVLPQTIWPSRYNADGTTSRPRGNPNWVKRTRHSDHVIARSVPRHVKKARAN